MECIGLVYHKLSLTRDKGRSGLRGPSYGHCFFDYTITIISFQERAAKYCSKGPWSYSNSLQNEDDSIIKRITNTFCYVLQYFSLPLQLYFINFQLLCLSLHYLYVVSKLGSDVNTYVINQNLFGNSSITITS